MKLPHIGWSPDRSPLPGQARLEGQAIPCDDIVIHRSMYFVSRR